MRKHIKNLIITMGLIILTNGCSVKYEAVINNESIKETVLLEETSLKSYQNAYYYTYNTLENFRKNSSELAKYAQAKKEEYINKYYLNKDNFKRDNSIVKEGEYTSYNFFINNNKKEFNQKNNFFINNIIRDSLIINDTNIILHLDNIPIGLLDEIDNTSISISTELNVISNNADNVENNIYTWNLTSSNYKTKNILLNIERPKAIEDNKSNPTNNNNLHKKKSPTFVIIIVVGIYIGVIIVVINIFNKKKKLF